MAGILKPIFRIFKFSFLFLVCATLIFLAAITFFEQPLPAPILRRVTNALSTDDILVSASSASFRLTYGIKLKNLRVLDRHKPAAPRTYTTRRTKNAPMPSVFPTV